MKKLILTLILCQVLTPCLARTITIDDDGPADFATIQEAVDDCNDGDVILLKDGTYTGDGNRDIEILDKSITIQSENGPENCIIDCGGSEQEPHRGFNIYGGIDTNCFINGLTIINGYADNGGAIRCENYCDSLTISNCHIKGNNAEYGGGLFCYVKGNITIVDCTFKYNRTEKAGGGIYCTNGRIIKITRCTIRANQAGEDGGGLYLGEYGWLTLGSSIIVANHGNDGGGIYISNPRSTEVLSSTIAYNSANNEGGGIFLNDLSTIMENLILWGNTDQGQTRQTAQVGGHEQYFGFSCIQDRENLHHDTNSINDDPMFVRVPDDGGDGWDIGDNDDFGDLHLQATSPCINAGKLIFFPNPNDEVDIDGEPRNMGTRQDMGADEFAPFFLVLKPTGSEVWAVGSMHIILWDSSTFDDTVDIHLSTDSGQNWTVIAEDIPDTGTYTWDIPDNIDSNACTLMVVPNQPESDFLAIESELFTIKPDSTGPTLTNKWPTQGGSNERTGASAYAGPELGCVKWQFETDGAVIGSVTVGVQDRVHIACEDGKLYTLASDGGLLWMYDANTPLITSPTIGPDGSLYVGAEDGTIFAINPNGNLRWKHFTEDRIYASPAVTNDGIVYAGSMDGTLYALGTDGSELWTMAFKGVGKNPSGSIIASPSIGSDGTVYIGSLYDPNLYALNPTDGSVRWACTFENLTDPCEEGGWPVASPVISPNGTIYQTLMHDSHLYAIDSDDGSILWSTDLADPCSGWFEPDYAEDYPNPDGWSEPAIGPDGKIYVSLDDPYLRAVSPNGQILWITKLGVVGTFVLTVDANGYIYAASDDGDVCLVSPEGVEVARYQTDGWPGYPVVAGPNKILLSDTRDYSVMMPDATNKVVAISTDGCNGAPLALHWSEDIDGSGTVDWMDIKILADNWLECTTFVIDIYQPSTCNFTEGRAYPDGDVDRNMSVDFGDWASLADRWMEGL